MARTSKLFNLLLRVSPFLDGQCLASIIVLLQRSGRLSSVCVCMCTCMYCRHVCVRMQVCIPVCHFASMWISIWVCIYVCMYVCTYMTYYVCTCVCMYVWMYVRMYVRVYVWMDVRTYVYTNTHLGLSFSCRGVPLAHSTFQLPWPLCWPSRWTRRRLIAASKKLSGASYSIVNKRQRVNHVFVTCTRTWITLRIQFVHIYRHNDAPYIYTRVPMCAWSLCEYTHTIHGNLRPPLMCSCFVTQFWHVHLYLLMAGTQWHRSYTLDTCQT